LFYLHSVQQEFFGFGMFPLYILVKMHAPCSEAMIVCSIFF
jgi:hypothetical protein